MATRLTRGSPTPSPAGQGPPAEAEDTSLVEATKKQWQRSVLRRYPEVLERTYFVEQRIVPAFGEITDDDDVHHVNGQAGADIHSPNSDSSEGWPGDVGNCRPDVDTKRRRPRRKKKKGVQSGSYTPTMRTDLSPPVRSRDAYRSQDAHLVWEMDTKRISDSGKYSHHRRDAEKRLGQRNNKMCSDQHTKTLPGECSDHHIQTLPGEWDDEDSENWPPARDNKNSYQLKLLKWQDHVDLERDHPCLERQRPQAFQELKAAFGKTRTIDDTFTHDSQRIKGTGTAKELEPVPISKHNLSDPRIIDRSRQPTLITGIRASYSPRKFLSQKRRREQATVCSEQHRPNTISDIHQSQTKPNDVSHTGVYNAGSSHISHTRTYNTMRKNVTETRRYQALTSIVSHTHAYNMGYRGMSDPHVYNMGYRRMSDPHVYNMGYRRMSDANVQDIERRSLSETILYHDGPKKVSDAHLHNLGTVRTPGILLGNSRTRSASDTQVYNAKCVHTTEIRSVSRTPAGCDGLAVRNDRHRNQKPASAPQCSPVFRQSRQQTLSDRNTNRSAGLQTAPALGRSDIKEYQSCSADRKEETPALRNPRDVSLPLEPGMLSAPSEERAVPSPLGHGTQFTAHTEQNGPASVELLTDSAGTDDQFQALADQSMFSAPDNQTVVHVSVGAVIPPPCELQILVPANLMTGPSRSKTTAVPAPVGKTTISTPVRTGQKIPDSTKLKRPQNKQADVLAPAGKTTQFTPQQTGHHISAPTNLVTPKAQNKQTVVQAPTGNMTAFSALQSREHGLAPVVKVTSPCSALHQHLSAPVAEVTSSSACQQHVPAPVDKMTASSTLENGQQPIPPHAEQMTVHRKQDDRIPVSTTLQCPAPDSRVGLRAALLSWQDSDVRDDHSQQQVLQCLHRLSEKQKEPMVVVSQLSYKNYLNVRTFAEVAQQLPRPVDLRQDRLHRGDFDILILHRHRGLIVGEVKSVGHGLASLPLTEDRKNLEVAKRAQRAALQLNKAERVLRHLVSDLPSPPRLTKTLMLPCVGSGQLRSVLGQCSEVNAALQQCLGTTASSQLQSDNCVMSDPVELCLTSDDLEDPTKWWSHLAAEASTDTAMTDDVFLDLVSRFVGPATSPIRLTQKLPTRTRLSPSAEDQSPPQK